MKWQDIKDALRPAPPTSEDEARARESVRQMSFGKKILWFVGYHKLLTLLVIIGLGLFIYACVWVSQDRPETVLYVTLVNPGVEDTYEAPVFHELLAEGDRDMADETERVVIMSLDMDEASNEAVYTYQTLYAQFLVGDIDIFAADPDTYMAFAINDGYCDLRKWLSEEELARYDSLLFYTESQETGEIYPCGFEIGPESALGDIYPNGCVIGVCVQANNVEVGWEVLLRLLEKTY